MTAYLHHPGIVVPDLDAAIAFYGALFGYREVFRGAWQAPAVIFDQIVGLEGSAGRSCLMQGAGGYLELFEYSAPVAEMLPESQSHQAGLRHLGFQVDDVDAMLEKLERIGGRRINPPATMPGGGRAVYARDPFGNLIELMTPGGRMPSL